MVLLAGIGALPVPIPEGAIRRRRSLRRRTAWSTSAGRQVGRAAAGRGPTCAH